MSWGTEQGGREEKECTKSSTTDSATPKSLYQRLRPFRRLREPGAWVQLATVLRGGLLTALESCWALRTPPLPPWNPVEWTERVGSAMNLARRDLAKRADQAVGDLKEDDGITSDF